MFVVFSRFEVGSRVANGGDDVDVEIVDCEFGGLQLCVELVVDELLCCRLIFSMTFPQMLLRSMSVSNSCSPSI